MLSSAVDEGLEEAPGAARDQPQRQCRVRRRDRQVDRRRGGRLAQRATAGDSTHKSQERRRDRPGVRPAQATRTMARQRRARRRPPSAGRNRVESSRGPTFACAAVTHSSRMPMRHEQAEQRPHDRVGHHPGLMRKKRDEERDLRQRKREIRDRAARADDCAARCPRGAARCRRATAGARAARWSQDEAVQISRGRRRQQSSRPARRGRPPAPTATGADCRASSSGRSTECADMRRPSAGDAAAAEDPGQQLPVAAHPAMLARRRDVVARGKFLDHLDVGDQTGARENALQQIVAEHRVLRNAALERGLEDVDIVDALAGIGAFFEQILIDVGNREGIGIEAAGARKDALEQRTFAADRQRRRHARLKQPWPSIDAAWPGIEVGRLSGCAILPISRLAAPRGSRVSASSVMT